MEVVLEMVLEFLAVLFDWQNSKKKPNKWLFYPLLILSAIVFLGVSIGVIVLGIVLLQKEMIVGILLILLGLIFIVSSVYKKIRRRR